MYGGGGDKIWEKMKDKVASIWLTDDMGYITSERQRPVFKDLPGRIWRNTSFLRLGLHPNLALSFINFSKENKI